MIPLNNPKGVMYLIAERIAQRLGGSKEDADAAVVELILQGIVPDFNGMLQDALDLIDKGSVDVARKYIEDVLTQEEYLGTKLLPLSYLGAFDSGFRSLCRKNNVIAAYVALTDMRHDTSVKVNVDTGGHHLANAFIMNKLDPGRHRPDYKDIAAKAVEAVEVADNKYWTATGKDVATLTTHSLKSRLDEK